jgi:prepilin-type N-terminal cleavage/methylation domain-containing protein
MKLKKYLNKKGGFTLIELLVVISIIAVLATIILFSVTQYISKGKNSSIFGNLAVLVPAGETYYNTNTNTPNSYIGFCDSDLVRETKENRLPVNTENVNCYVEGGNPSGLCCEDSDSEWVACAFEFGNGNAFCVDSRGFKREIDKTQCPITGTPFRCPESLEGI